MITGRCREADEAEVKAERWFVPGSETTIIGRRQEADEAEVKAETMIIGRHQEADKAEVKTETVIIGRHQEADEAEVKTETVTIGRHQEADEAEVKAEEDADEVVAIIDKVLECLIDNQVHPANIPINLYLFLVARTSSSRRFLLFWRCLLRFQFG